MSFPVDLAPAEATVRFIAGRRLVIDGEVRERGAEIPEAESFKNLASYINSGQIIRFYDTAGVSDGSTVDLDGGWLAPSRETLVGVLDSANAGPLKALAEELGIDPTGKKDALAARIAATVDVVAPAPPEEG